ncbi:2-aminoethylphosphonate aminotransferase [Pseudalkalibacillus hwajinpoensis]|uniref:2-aminoethylphosphonate--pyruvate transaminase n=1 Tax=Guptibacillus hwajinpoensis TaxID=208199 RepID=A0A4U1MK37_9BACL|nr:2-aminoethylphosphonate--pyruvate transaminase [Pseudalkalibacillus hwajinpoensis]TKD70935.1 2-aminoethylphosphonate--pyruvate transaminase [Pseudalkalibacillus hwajinpoensis]
MIKTAVILAAGMGSRIRNRSEGRPKGFLTIDGKPLIEHSIEKLLDAGIENIYIGTGYKKEEYKSLSQKYSQITCFNNPDYNASGSLFTLYQIEPYITDDFLLLESDILFERKALQTVLANKRSDVILASELTSSGDEVFIEVDKDQNLIMMSKNTNELSAVFAELVGIVKLSLSTFKILCKKASMLFQSSKDLHYEDGLVHIAKEVDLYVQNADNLVWCEVDDEHHYQRANNLIAPLIKARESSHHVERKILLNPGPATTTDTVKHAQIVADICPRESDFGDTMTFVSQALTEFVGNPNEYTTIMFGGSGTAAVESILSSVVDKEAIVIVNNGAYGERMLKIATIYGLNVLEYRSPLESAIDLIKLELLIQNARVKISHLMIVHCETTTGLLNNIEAVGKICEKHNVAMIVDAMSSYGAIPIDMKRMNISYLAASSNKNLQGMAGVSFVIANNEQLDKIKEIKPRNLYLNLSEQYEHFVSTKQMRFTPPVQTLYALRQAILETQWEGIERRYNRYSKSWRTLLKGLKALGLTHLIDEPNHSRIITSIVEPSHQGYDFDELHDFLYDRGFTIYPGKLDDLNTFRVANIGDITYKDMECFLTLLEQYLKG